MTLPVSRGCGCWGLMSMCGIIRTDADGGPREFTGIVDHSRGGSSHGPLEWLWSREGLAPRMRTGWPSAEKTSVQGCKSRRWIPFQGQQERHRLACSQGATSVLDTFHIVTLAGDAPGEVRRRVQQDTLGHRGRKDDPLYQIRNLLRASRAHAHPTSTRTPP